MGIEKAAWKTFWTAPTIAETWPSHDVINHKHSFLCPCNPKVHVIWAEGGEPGWQIVHNTFDEFLDETQTEPYKGL